MIAESTFEFLRQLTQNNTREWFQANRDWYENERQGFVHFCDEVLQEIKEFEPSFYDTQIKDCIFRINRDIRFSKDKSPYKRHFAAAFGQGGKNSGKEDYYLHIQDGESFIGGGIWQPTASNLSKFRQEIDYSPEPLLEILNHKNFKKNFPIIFGEKLKKAPKGYDLSHPHIDLLQHKEMFFMRKFSNEEVLSPNFKKEVIQGFKTLKPFLDYVNELFYNE